MLRSSGCGSLRIEGIGGAVCVDWISDVSRDLSSSNALFARPIDGCSRSTIPPSTSYASSAGITGKEQPTTKHIVAIVVELSTSLARLRRVGI